MNVLVVGGSGFIGTHLSRELLDRGHEVAVLSRHPDADGVPSGVETVRGDVTAYDSIEDAFEGRDAVVYLVSLSPLFKPKGGNDRHFAVHTDGARNVLQAAEAHDVDRFVHVSGLGANPNAPTAYLRAKGEAEALVTDSDRDWVVFRPSVVFGEGDEFRSFTKRVTPPGVAPLPGGGKTAFQPIWVEDLAGMLADAVEDDEHVGETYELGGPDVLTLKEVAKLVRGGVAVVPVPMSLAGIGMKLAGSIPRFPLGADQYRSLQLDHTVADNDVDAFGRVADDLTSFRDYLSAET
jgi:NADH dehydrogenase